MYVCIYTDIDRYIYIDIFRYIIFICIIYISNDKVLH